MEEKEVIQNFGIDIESLKREQLKLSANLNFKDLMDFNLATKFGAFDSIIVKNKIISVVVVCDRNFNILEQQYFFDSLKFPYLFEFRAYRELPSMIMAFNKLNERPEIIFVRGHGITHARLGLASHFSISVNTPAIGVSDSLIDSDKVVEDDIVRGGKKIGKVLKSKENSNPLYISPGNNISINTAYNLSKLFVKEPHKLPEPLYLAHKYARSVKKELGL